MSRIIRLAPRLSNGGLIGDTEGPESYLRELDTFPSRFARATGGTETVIEESQPLASLLLNFDGANGSTTFTDQSIYAHTVTANGNAQISTTESKFGGSSLALDGSGDSVTLSHSFLSDSLSGYDQDFTFECWFYTASLSANRAIISSREGISPLFGFTLRHQTDGKIRLFGYVGSGGTTAIDQTTASAVSTGEWHHVAVTHTASSNDWKCFVDGALVIEDTGAVVLDGASPILYLGNESNSNYHNGYIDSLRITKGQALYTAAFTPPSTAPTVKTGKYYRVHTFTDVGTSSLTFTRGGDVEYLVVGGGGGGGGTSVGNAGGGGAGGFVSGNALIRAGATEVAVGDGGSVGASGTKGNNGSNSSFYGVVAVGGGGGASYNTSTNQSASDGGSGGGSSQYDIRSAATGGAGTAGQGFSGGGRNVSNALSGAGGGGAGATGQDTSDTDGVVAGSGGDGLQSLVSGSASYYSGGGGGSMHTSGTGVASGGLGGGGSGASAPDSVAATSGSANTGGGGGGGGQSRAGGSGGSGIVIARYRITQAEYEAEAA